MSCVRQCFSNSFKLSWERVCRKAVSIEGCGSEVLGLQICIEALGVGKDLLAELRQRVGRHCGYLGGYGKSVLGAQIARGNDMDERKWQDNGDWGDWGDCVYILVSRSIGGQYES